MLKPQINRQDTAAQLVCDQLSVIETLSVVLFMRLVAFFYGLSLTFT